MTNYDMIWQAAEVIRRVPFAGALNFRDIGGYPTPNGGQTRWGVVYRSDALHYMTPADLPVFDSLGVKAIYDLRRADHLGEAAHVAGEGVQVGAAVLDGGELGLLVRLETFGPGTAASG